MGGPLASLGMWVNVSLGTPPPHTHTYQYLHSFFGTGQCLQRRHLQSAASGVLDGTPASVVQFFQKNFGSPAGPGGPTALNAPHQRLPL